MSKLDILEKRVLRLEKMIDNVSSLKQNKLLNSKEICKRVAFGAKWFYKHRSDLIEAGMFKNGRWLISEENLNAYLAKKKIIK